MTTYLYLNGEIEPLDAARISPMDIGLLRGYAVFDLLRTVHGRPWLLAEHLRRLHASAAVLGLSVPDSDERITAVIEELLARNGFGPGADATVRLVLTGGVSSDGMAFDPGTPTFMIMTHPIAEPPATLYTQGGRLMTRLHRREVPTAKTTNYVTMLRHKGAAAEMGAMDLLYHDGDRVFEAASASVYFVKDGVILAPDSDVLWGTVGTFVLDLAQDSYSVQRATVTLAEALDADEVFLTSTTRGVVPIVAFDDTPVGDGTVGPVVTELMRLYREAVFGEQ